MMMTKWQDSENTRRMWLTKQVKNQREGVRKGIESVRVGRKGRCKSGKLENRKCKHN